MDAFASVDDLQARYRTLDADEQARATALLADASFILRAEFARAGKTYDETDEVMANNVSMVCCAMVKRVLANGIAGDYTQYSQTAGSFNEQYTFANPQGDMYLTAAERRILGLPKRRFCMAALMPKGYGNA